MPNIHLLVIRGPHFDLLGRRGHLEKEPSSEVVDAALHQAFGALAAIKSLSASSEAALVELVRRLTPWPTHAIVAAGSLAPTGYVLRECLELAGIPWVDVGVSSLPRADQLAKASVFKDGAVAQVVGPAGTVFLQAAEKLVGRATQPLKLVVGSARATPKPAVSSAPARKTLGRAPARDNKSSVSTAAKTLGKKTEEAAAPAGRGVTRVAVKQQIANRLSGRISASELATWGREQWLRVDRGGATEAGQRELLSETLQSLALSSAPGAQLSDPELLELMARMG